MQATTLQGKSPVLASREASHHSKGLSLQPRHTWILASQGVTAAQHVQPSSLAARSDNQDTHLLTEAATLVPQNSGDFQRNASARSRCGLGKQQGPTLMVPSTMAKHATHDTQHKMTFSPTIKSARSHLLCEKCELTKRDMVHSVV